MLKLSTAAAIIALSATTAFAAGHAAQKVVAVDQDVSNGIISAKQIVAAKNGWMVVHKTDGTKPGDAKAEGSGHGMAFRKSGVGSRVSARGP